ncbi:hypothetical protein HBDW_34220 [Herbaspirillum sp. DW155]|nr:hypothetical protein HBDW_34220 [Herbaspirillum sp. DW155]
MPSPHLGWRAALISLLLLAALLMVLDLIFARLQKWVTYVE